MVKKSMVVAHKALANGVEIADSASVTLPSFEFSGAELKGGGIAGPITIPSITQIGEMTTSISARDFGNELKNMITGTAVELEYRFVEDTVDSNSNVIPAGTKIFIKGWLSKLELGKVEGGSAREASAEFNVSRYREVRDGEEFTCVDKLNYIFKIGGKDLLAKYRDML